MLSPHPFESQKDVILPNPAPGAVSRSSLAAIGSQHCICYSKRLIDAILIAPIMFQASAQMTGGIAGEILGRGDGDTEKHKDIKQYL